VCPSILLVDFDGTACHSLPALREHFLSFMKDHGARAWLSDFDRLNGQPVAECMAILAREGLLTGDVDELTVRYHEGLDTAVITSEPSAGLADLVEFCSERGVAVAIVSSGRAGPINAWLRGHDLDHRISHVVSSESVSRGKPSPEPYLTAMAMTGRVPEECVAVEDSAAGVESSLSAGIETFVVADVDDKRAQRVGGLAELQTVLEARCLPS